MRDTPEGTPEAGIDRARAVREGEELDVAALDAYLRESLEGYAGPLDVKQFPSGHSNLTYFLQAGPRDAAIITGTEFPMQTAISNSPSILS